MSTDEKPKIAEAMAIPSPAEIAHMDSVELEAVIGRIVEEGNEVDLWRLCRHIELALNPRFEWVAPEDDDPDLPGCGVLIQQEH